MFDERINNILKEMTDGRYTELYLSAGLKPYARTEKNIFVFEDYDVLNRELVENMLKEMTSARAYQDFLEKGNISFSYSVSGQGRYMVNAFKQRNSIAIIFKPVYKKIPEDRVNLPSDISKVLDDSYGINIIASINNRKEIAAKILKSISEEKECLIMTIEDTIKYPIRSDISVVYQREKKSDFNSVSEVLEYINNIHPDILYIDLYNLDWQDYKRIFELAESGIKIFIGIKGFDAANALGSITESFPNEYEHMVQAKIKRNIRYIIYEDAGNNNELIIKEYVSEK